MHDALLVRGCEDLAELVEQRHEAFELDAALRGEQLVEWRAAHELHRDPQEAIGLGAERVRVRRIRMVELRSELRLPEEPLDHVAGFTVSCMKDLDHRLSREQRLLREVHGTEAAFTELLLYDEVTERATDWRLVARGRALDHGAIIAAPSATRAARGRIPAQNDRHVPADAVGLHRVRRCRRAAPVLFVLGFRGLPIYPP